MFDRDLFGVARSAGGAAPPPAEQLDLISEQLCRSVSLMTGGGPIRFQLWSGSGANPMGQDHTEFSDDIGPRWAAWLRQVYGWRDAAKRVARDFGVQPVTAESWLAGQAPQGRRLAQAARLHGAGVLFAVLAPGVVPPTEAEALRALDEVRREIDRLGDRLARLTVEAG